MGDTTIRHRARTIGFAAAAVGVAAVVTVAAFAIVRPHVSPTAAGTGTGLAALVGAARPVPIIGPVTPAGHPYDELAILRSQRLSTDVMPADVVRRSDDSIDFVPASARLLATEGHDRIFLAASTGGGICTLLTDDGHGDGGFNSGCTDRLDAKPGALVSDVGFGAHTDIRVFADGVPAATKTTGFRQIASNVWLAKASRAVAAPRPASVSGDPLAFPAVAPYSEFAILRRPVATSDAVPEKLTDDGSISSSIIGTSLRKAGSYRGTTVWAGASTSGGACLLVAGAGSEALESGCSGPTGGVAVGAGDDSSLGDFWLVPDGDDRTGGGLAHGRRLAANVWVSPPTKS